MKGLLLTLLILSTHAQASFQCDLNVNVQETVSGAVTKVIGKGSHNSQFEAKPISEAEAVQDCVKNGGANCRVNSGATVCTYHSNGAETFRDLPWVKPSYSCTAIAEGTKSSSGRSLSKSEIAAKKQALVCKKIEECRNAALNDNSVTSVFFEKLDYLSKKNTCE